MVFTNDGHHEVTKSTKTTKSTKNSLVRISLAGFVILRVFVMSVAAAQPSHELRWAGDPEGGAPFVEADPSKPDAIVGFDVEVAALIAQKLGRTPTFINVDFRSLDQAIARGDADIALSGIEDTPARRATMAPTIPYYEFREVLSVRDSDRARFHSLADLRGRRVATLGGTIAYEILLSAEREHGIAAISYDDDVHPYSDLVIGRVDAVLLDNVLAERRHLFVPGFTVQPETVAIGHYVGVLARRQGGAPRFDRRDPARRDARWDAGAHSPEMARLERRSACAVRAAPRA